MNGLEQFEVVTTTAGAVSIRNNVVNEIMHNPVGPWAEANSLYVDQSRLRERFDESPGCEFVLFDVGLGAASNAVAVLSAIAQSHALGPHKCFRLISFENDLSLLRFALKHVSAFDHYRGYEGALEAIASGYTWQNSCKTISWECRVGNFPDLIKTETMVPEIVLYDPYSPAVNPEMWTLACFQSLFDICSRSRLGCSLYTYSVATRVRAALLAAGFYVGYGQPTGLKEETTQAGTRVSDISNPLGQNWLLRWQKSHASIPHDITIEKTPGFVLKILEHPQF